MTKVDGYDPVKRSGSLKVLVPDPPSEEASRSTDNPNLVIGDLYLYKVVSGSLQEGKRKVS